MHTIRVRGVLSKAFGSLLILGLSLAIVGRAKAGTITLDFEGFPDSTILTTQYPGIPVMQDVKA